MLVPVEWWNTLFISGHGFWTSLENALMGPIIACLSFVCSVGNVPMAAALWHGGIAFGGVISFLFADLLAMPLILIYRKYYGGRLTLRLVGVFYLVMVAAGLAVEGIFSLAGLIPTERPSVVAPTHFSWNYTTVLNLIFLVVLAVLYWLYRHRDRLGGGRGYAIDPVCGMQVRVADAPAQTVLDGTTHYFCGDGCRDAFVASHSHLTRPLLQRKLGIETFGIRTQRCPICGGGKVTRASGLAGRRAGEEGDPHAGDHHRWRQLPVGAVADGRPVADPVLRRRRPSGAPGHRPGAAGEDGGVGRTSSSTTSGCRPRCRPPPTRAGRSTAPTSWW